MSEPQQEEQSPLKKIWEQSKEYAGIRTEILLLTASEKGASLIAQLGAMCIILLCLFIVFIIGSITLALALDIFVDPPYMGFLIVTGFYLLITLLLYINRRAWIKRPISNIIIKTMFSKEAEDNNE